MQLNLLKIASEVCEGDGQENYLNLPSFMRFMEGDYHIADSWFRGIFHLQSSLEGA